MTRLWLVRHAPTGARGLCGWTDLPADLSDSAALARLSARLPAAAILSSDLRRAVQTAAALTGPGRPLAPPDRRWREIHFGTWEGKTADMIDPAQSRPFWNGTHPAPGGEGWDDLTRRITAAMDSLPPAADVIVVAHMGAIMAAWGHAATATPVQAMAHTVPPLSVTRLDRGRDGWRPAGPVGTPA